MNNRTFIFLFSIVSAIFVTGCSEEPPKCGDIKTLSIAKEIIAQNFVKFTDISDAITEDEIQKTLKFTYPRASAFNENIKKFECEAELNLSESINLSISYNSQLDDKNEHIVSVRGIDYSSSLLLQPILSEIKKIRLEAKRVSRNKPRIHLPTRADAIQDLFDIDTKAEKVKTSDDAISSVWFEKTFKNNGVNFHVVFIKTQAIEEDGSVVSCHSCGVSISSITYKRISINNAYAWQWLSKQTNLGTLGSYGEAPEFKEVESINLSKDVIAFLIPESYASMGEFIGGKHIFTFHKDTWKKAGFVTTDANNSGACDESEMDSCYEYSGKISVVEKQNVDYPNLLVTLKGSELSENGTIIPAKNLIYSFDGNLYSSTNKD